MNRRKVLVLLPMLLLVATAAANAQEWPKKFSHHSDEGNSMLDGGRHAWSDVTVSEDGRVDVINRVENRVTLAGYCFRAIYFFRDKAGNVLHDHHAPQYCVDGTHVPFAGPSKRQDHLTFRLPQEILPKVHDVVIVHGPGGRQPAELLGDAVKKGVGIFGFIFGK